MPDFVAEDEASSALGSGGAKDSLMKLHHLPYKTLSHKLQKSALDLKQMVVRETWGLSLSGNHVNDFTLYTGALGIAFLLFKSYQLSKDANDLKLCSQIVKVCDSASADSGYA